MKEKILYLANTLRDSLKTNVKFSSVVLLCFLTTFILPSGNSWFIITFRAAFCMPLIFTVWKDCKPTEAVENTLTTISILIASNLTKLDPRRLSVGLSLCFVAVLMPFVITYPFKFRERIEKKEIYNWLVWIFEALVINAFLAVQLGRYTFLNGFYPFWQVGIVLGILISVAVTLKCLHKDADIKARVMCFIMIFIIVLLLFGIIVANLNYALDKSEPESITATVDKVHSNINSESNRTTYSIKVTVDGRSYSIRVPYYEYLDYKRGDQYTFNKFKGAFGFEYYMAKAYS